MTKSESVQSRSRRDSPSSREERRVGTIIAITTIPGTLVCGTANPLVGLLVGAAGTLAALVCLIRAEIADRRASSAY
jgi:hypothetical protein